jgi:hypothetical protein
VDPLWHSIVFFGIFRMLHCRVVDIRDLGEFYCANPNNSAGIGEMSAHELLAFWYISAQHLDPVIHTEMIQSGCSGDGHANFGPFRRPPSRSVGRERMRVKQPPDRPPVPPSSGPQRSEGREHILEHGTYYTLRRPPLIFLYT